MVHPRSATPPRLSTPPPSSLTWLKKALESTLLYLVWKPAYNNLVRYLRLDRNTRYPCKKCGKSVARYLLGDARGKNCSRCRRFTRFAKARAQKGLVAALWAEYFAAVAVVGVVIAIAAVLAGGWLYARGGGAGNTNTAKTTSATLDTSTSTTRRPHMVQTVVVVQEHVIAKADTDGPAKLAVTSRTVTKWVPAEP